MHIILGVLGVIVTILVLLNRLTDAGIDIGWLNPFAWRRRRDWRKKYKGNPIFQLKEPIEVAGLLCFSMAKIDGEISKQEKQLLLSLFKSELKRDDKQAADLLMSSSYLFGDGHEALAKPESVVKAVIDDLSKEQAESISDLLEQIMNASQSNRDDKQKYLSKVKSVFAQKFEKNDGW